MRDFLLFSGRSGKPQSTQRDAEKNNNPLRSSASSAVNLFCHDPLFQNKLKSLKNEGKFVDIKKAIDYTSKMPQIIEFRFQLRNFSKENPFIDKSNR